MDVDVSVIFGFLVFLIEFFWRGASTAWPSLAILSTAVFIFLCLVLVGYVFEHPPMIAESLILQDGNAIGTAPLALMVIIILVDFVGHYLIPSALHHWTMPLSWILLAVFCVFFYAIILVARQVKLLAFPVGALVVTYFIWPYLPTKLACLLVSLAFSAALASAGYSIEIIATGNKPGSAWPYETSAIASFLLDISTGHYTTHGSAHWVYLGGLLALNGLMCSILVIALLPAFRESATKGAQEAEQEAADASKNQTHSSTTDSSS